MGKGTLREKLDPSFRNRDVFWDVLTFFLSAQGFQCNDFPYAFKGSALITLQCMEPSAVSPPWCSVLKFPKASQHLKISEETYDI